MRQATERWANARMNPTDVVVSDGFFPFNDSVHHAYLKGCRILVCPKGSKNDQKLIDYVESVKDHWGKHEMMLVMLEKRTFSH